MSLKDYISDPYCCKVSTDLVACLNGKSDAIEALNSYLSTHITSKITSCSAELPGQPMSLCERPFIHDETEEEAIAALEEEIACYLSNYKLIMNKVTSCVGCMQARIDKRDERIEDILDQRITEKNCCDRNCSRLQDYIGVLIRDGVEAAGPQPPCTSCFSGEVFPDFVDVSCGAD